MSLQDTAFSVVQKLRCVRASLPPSSDFGVATRVHPWLILRVTMRPLIQEITTAHTPELLVEALNGEAGIVLLRTGLFDSPSARYSFVAAKPFLTFRSFGSRCEITFPGSQPSTPTNREQALNPQPQFGNPWQILDALLARCELLDEIDLPFPLGGCFGDRKSVV